jgi:hypothetical protein
MNKYLIKISYKDEGFSVWKNESTPIPIYSSEREAYQQACAIYCNEVDFLKLDPIVSNNIQNLISTGNYQQAVLEMNFSDTMRFIICPTKLSKPNSIGMSISNSSQIKINLNKSGAICRKCNNYNQFAVADANDGKHTCYACRP